MTQSWRRYLDLGKKLFVFFLLFSVCTVIQIEFVSSFD